MDQLVWMFGRWWKLGFDLAYREEDGRQRMCWNGGGHGIAWLGSMVVDRKIVMGNNHRVL